VKPSPLFRLTFLLILFLTMSYCSEEKISPSGSGSVEGKVLDEEDLSPIANAEVTTSPPTHTVLTDSTGSFLLEELEVGDYNVIAQKRDYFSSSKAIKVNLNSTVHTIINLKKRDADEKLPEFSSLFYPEKEQQDVSVNVNISWQLTEPCDSTEFELKLYESGRLVDVDLENPTDTFALVNGLKFSATYLWQVSAENKAGKVYSDLRSFTTRSLPEDCIMYAKRVDDISQIFVTDTLLENNIQITHNNYHSWRPRVNEQKTKIAFLSTRDVTTHLYTMDIDGSNVEKVTDIPSGGYYSKGVGFSWLPNGEKLVFSLYNSLYTANYDGTGLTKLTSISEEKHFREVDWSPAGNKIVALALGKDYYDAEIMVMNPDGSDKEVLIGDMEGALANPVFSVDGNRILYTYDNSGFNSDKRRQLDARIYQYDLQTGDTTDLSANRKPAGTNDLAPGYTPDGGKIVFFNGKNTIGSRKDLWIMGADYTERHYRNRLIEDVEMGGL